MKTFNWSGQFQDQSIEASEYNNLTQHDTVSFAMYLFDHRRDKPEYVAQAEELLRFGEDQFVVWERPLSLRRSDLADWQRTTTHWLPIPCAMEQYHYYVPIDASAAKMILGFQKAYEATRKPLYLAKACSLANAMTSVQIADGPNAGLYRIAWCMLEDPKVLEKPLPFYWINCLVWDARALLGLGELLASEKKTKVSSSAKR
jgi:maltose/maltodextrin transport system substrate-binding protein